MSSNTGGMLGSLKQAFHVGSSKKQPTTATTATTPPASADSTSPLSTGARQFDDPVPTDAAPTPMNTTHTTHTTGTAPTSTTRTTHTSTTTGAGTALNPAAGGTAGAGTMGRATAPEEGSHKGVGTDVKTAFSAAPWEPHHERTMEALTHAKAAHIKAVQAQAELQAAQKARQDAELAERHRLELERETALYTQGQDDLGARTREYETAKQALAEHSTKHDNAARTAREAEAAALAKEEEAKGLLPMLEEHERTVGPMQKEATTIQRARAEAEERRAVLVRELEALDAALGGHRSQEAAALKKLENQQRLGKGHQERALALAEEARLLRGKATEANAAIQPHAQRLKDAHGVLALRESGYHKARMQAEAGRDKLPMLQKQADEAARVARASAMSAQEHAGAFEKLKREAEVEDAKKTELWSEVQKVGHFTDENASRTELHNLADRFHTVLTRPIDTGRLAGPEVTTEIQQSAARIAGDGAHKGTGMGAVAGGAPATKATTMVKDTAGPGVGRDVTGPTRGTGLAGNTNAPIMGERGAMGSNSIRGNTAPSQPGLIRKATSVTTPAHSNVPTAMREE